VMNVMIPVVAEDANVVDESFNAIIQEIFEDFFDGSLRPIRRLSKTLTSMLAAILAKGGNENTQPGTFFIQLIRVVSSGNVDLGEEVS